MAENIEEIILEISETGSDEQIDNLARILGNMRIDKATADQLSVLWDAWEDLFSQDNIEEGKCTLRQSNLVLIAAAKYDSEPGTIFRKVLFGAARLALGPNLGRSSVTRAAGLRDEKLQVREIINRLNRIKTLTGGNVVFFPSSGKWGSVETIDTLAGTLVTGLFRGNGSCMVIPLDRVLVECAVFAPMEELRNVLIPTDKPIPATKVREIIAKAAKTPVSSSTAKVMALNGCARKMTPDAFKAYWDSEVTAAPTAKRRSCEGRNMQEVEILLNDEIKAGAGKFTEEEVQKFTEFFTKLRPESAAREPARLATILAAIVDRCDASPFHAMVEPLLSGKAIFWPADITKAKDDPFEVWGGLPAKTLAKLAVATQWAIDDDYLALLMTRIPLKALNAVGMLVMPSDVEAVIIEHHSISSDVMCWVWRNRKRKDIGALKSLINLDNTIQALGTEPSNKIWAAAWRELRTLFMDNADYQKALLEAAKGFEDRFGGPLSCAIFLSASERQSLLMKLARVSPEVQKLLESGAAEKILKAGRGVNRGDKLETGIVEAMVSSTKSIKNLNAELDNLVNVQLPENRMAIAVAREHGDLRENSEFGAAKERKVFLLKRRSELERNIEMTQIFKVGLVKIDNRPVPGCEVDFDLDDGTKEVVYVVGIWDGDPDRKMISYDAPLGRELMKHIVGDKITVFGKSGKISAVKMLPPELIAELDEQ
ncbi:MAG: GreA/GreB family elongation factor [Victivallaceae bacterium]|nr:GreA/GreB family elongation factor [Victivallaceae bacterium]